MHPPALAASFALPDWIAGVVPWHDPLPDDASRMALAIALARENVARGSGGPFGAVITEQATGRIVGVGVNAVVRLNNCTLHAEMMAFQLAQQRVGSYTLAAPGLPAHDLFTSCEPCAMCLGAALWSGVRRIVCGATRDDAARLQFEEGPVFPTSWRYLEDRGIVVVKGVRRAEARAVLEQYREHAGPIYNA